MNDQRKKIMTIELKGDPSISFAADDYAIGILLRLSPGLEHVKISHPDKGELAVSPKHGSYFYHVADAAEFFQADKSSFTVTEVDEKFPPEMYHRRIEDLLWEAALHAAQGRLIDGLHIYDVLQFTRWPNLTRVPLTPNVMRICALLTRFPSGVHLARAILDVEEKEIYSVCSAAKAIGIVNLMNRKNQPDAAEEARVVAQAQKASASGPGQFLNRLFMKLSGL